MLFDDLLVARVKAAGLTVDSTQRAALRAYFELLKHWNKRINLTALPLDSPTNATIDRLFLEPILAAMLLGDRHTNWFDLGSGGGSPAIPMKTCWPRATLTMVESKSRKGAFLREAIREMAIPNTSVANSRFEVLSREARTRGVADLVTVRAVKPNAVLHAAAFSLLRVGGTLAMFSSSEQPSWNSPAPALFSRAQAKQLMGTSCLVVGEKLSQ